MHLFDTHTPFLGLSTHIDLLHMLFGRRQDAHLGVEGHDGTPVGPHDRQVHDDVCGEHDVPACDRVYRREQDCDSVTGRHTPRLGRQDRKLSHCTAAGRTPGALLCVCAKQEGGCDRLIGGTREHV